MRVSLAAALEGGWRMYIIIYDFGTSSVKTCLFNIDSEIHIVANAKADYGIYLSEGGGAEQDTEEWWKAICSTTRALFDHSAVKPDEIEGIAFCSQMGGTVLVDEDQCDDRRTFVGQTRVLQLFCRTENGREVL